jgi:uncharacterized protein with PIN domain
MKKTLEGAANFGCGTIIFATASVAIDKRIVYEMAYDSGGRSGVEPALDMFEESMKGLPPEVIDNPEKVKTIRPAVERKYVQKSEKRKREAALKVVDMLEARLVAKNIVKSDRPEREKLADYGVAAGKATRATLDMGRIVAYAIPITRPIAMRHEIRKYGVPQEAVTPELLTEVVRLVN